SKTIRAARSRSSDENFDRVRLGLSIAPSSQELEPPANPGRFTVKSSPCCERTQILYFANNQPIGIVRFLTGQQ
ncbi:MAG: hypothetical protein WAS73_04615, partial [Defluviicoccus sp.]